MSAFELEPQGRTRGIEARLRVFGDAMHHELGRTRVDDANWIEIERGMIGDRVRLHVASGGHEKASGCEREAARVQSDESGGSERVTATQIAEADAQQSDAGERRGDPEGS